MAELSPEQWQEIEGHIFTGEKIAAIRRYRELVPGTGLAEAKAAIEKMEADLRQKAPEKFTSAPRKAGCTGVLAGLAFLVFLTAAVLLWGLSN